MGNKAMSKNRTTSKSSQRQASQTRKRKQRRSSSLMWGGVGVGIIIVLGFLIWQAFRPATGEAVSVPANYETHIQEGTPPGPYPSDPPAGGVHYGSDFPAQFFQETDVESLPEYPEGYLVHNLEHGYVIFWYNCAVLDETGCNNLKDGIQKVMSDNGGTKLIAFPWKTIDVPLVITSWGKLQRFDTFNAAQASAFVKANRNHAPEPNAP